MALLVHEDLDNHKFHKWLLSIKPQIDKVLSKTKGQSVVQILVQLEGTKHEFTLVGKKTNFISLIEDTEFAYVELRKRDSEEGTANAITEFTEITCEDKGDTSRCEATCRESDV